MKVVDGDWTSRGIILKISCDCGNVFSHPTWKRWAHCPKCGERGDLIQLKSDDVERTSGTRGIINRTS